MPNIGVKTERVLVALIVEVVPDAVRIVEVPVGVRGPVTYQNLGGGSLGGLEVLGRRCLCIAFWGYFSQ